MNYKYTINNIDNMDMDIQYTYDKYNDFEISLQESSYYVNLGVMCIWSNYFKCFKNFKENYGRLIIGDDNITRHGLLYILNEIYDPSSGRKYNKPVDIYDVLYIAYFWDIPEIITRCCVLIKKNINFISNKVLSLFITHANYDMINYICEVYTGDILTLEIISPYANGPWSKQIYIKKLFQYCTFVNKNKLKIDFAPIKDSPFLSKIATNVVQFFQEIAAKPFCEIYKNGVD